MPLTRAFTLLEMLVVLMIIGLLGISALPLYEHITLKSQRMAAVNALLALQVAQARYYWAYGCYTDDLQVLGITRPQRYQLQITLADQGRYFQAEAVASGAQQADTPCRRFVIDSLGYWQAFGVNGTINTVTCGYTI